MTRWAMGVLAAVLGLGCDSIIKADAPVCVNACVAGDTKCAGAAGVQTCATAADGCTVWSGIEACPDPDPGPCIAAGCSDGKCSQLEPANLSCDDGIECTLDDSCTAGDCAGTPNHVKCDDGAFCNGPEACEPGALADPETGCIGGTAPEQPADENTDDCLEPGECAEGANHWPLVTRGLGAECDDSVGCTVDDVCDQGGQCEGTPTDALCDNETFCDGQETCAPLVGCVDGAPPLLDDGVDCTLDFCSEDDDAVVHEPKDAECDDGDWCDGAEICTALVGCEEGAAPALDDGVGCTVDACDEGADLVTHTADATLCDDGKWCNGAETCDGIKDCQPGVAPDLSDAVDCTVDTCDEDQDVALHTPDHALCDDGAACNGAEQCEPSLGGCQSGAAESDFCDDGLYCTGTEACDPKSTQANDDGCVTTALDLDDQIACTLDSCDDDLNKVVHAPDHGSCDDGAFCNGEETCLGAAQNADGCSVGVAPTPPADDEPTDCWLVGPCVETSDNFPLVAKAAGASCDDGFDCTDGDQCDDLGGECGGTPDDDKCDDGKPCTADACNAAVGCLNVATVAPCSDLDACTEGDACDGEACVGALISCDDGDPCTVDNCDGALGCRHFVNCTPECGCVEACVPGGDGFACDDQDDTTAGDFCLAGLCAGFKVYGGALEGFDANTVLDLSVHGNTVWAVGRNIGSNQVLGSWVAPIEPGVGLLRDRGSEYAGKTLSRAAGGLVVGNGAAVYSLRGNRVDNGSSQSIHTAGVWALDAGLAAAVSSPISGFGDISAIHADPVVDGDRSFLLAGRNKDKTSSVVTRCDRGVVSGGEWLCGMLPITGDSPSINQIVAGFLPQVIVGFGTSYASMLGVLSSGGELKVTLFEAISSGPSFNLVGGFFSSPGNYFINDMAGTAPEPGKLWAVGIGGFLATPAEVGSGSLLWKSNVLENQNKSFLQTVTANDVGSFVLSERADVGPLGAKVYAQDLHYHAGQDSDLDRWTTIRLDRKSYTCFEENCPDSPESAWSVLTSASAPGRIVLAGTGFDSSTGTTHTRVFERVLDDGCSGTLFAAAFDDGTLGGFTTDSTDAAVGWAPAPTDWIPDGQGQPFRGTAYLGDPVAKNYVGSGAQITASLMSPPLPIPAQGSTVLRFSLWQHTENNPDWDRFQVRVTCDGCAGSELVFDAKEEAVAQFSWEGIEIPLDAYKGKTITLELRFDTSDGVNNNYTGVFLDAVRVVTDCSAPCDVGDCDDLDPCTSDGCYLGQCLSIPACVKLPFKALDDAAVVKGERRLDSIGWAAEGWATATGQGGFLGPLVETSVAGAASDETATLWPPQLDLSFPVGGTDLTFTVERVHAPNPGCTLALIATDADTGQAAVIWQAQAADTEVQQNLVSMAPLLTQVGPHQLRFEAKTTAGSTCTWRLWQFQ